MIESAEPPDASVTGDAAGPPSATAIVTAGPAPAPPAADGPKNSYFGEPSSAHAVGPVFFTDTVSYELPAAVPPKAADAAKTPVEQVAAVVTPLAPGAVDVVGVVGATVVVVDAVVVGTDGDEPHAATSRPKEASANSGAMRRELITSPR